MGMTYKHPDNKNNNKPLAHITSHMFITMIITAVILILIGLTILMVKTMRIKTHPPDTTTELTTQAVTSETNTETDSIRKTESTTESDIISKQESILKELGVEPYTGEPYTVINSNVPFFTTDEQKNATSDFLSFSELDALQRPQTAYACLSHSSMPSENEERGEIGQIKPAGWHTVKYPEIISDLYLYNRCHLIGWQLCGENANEKNLITGTRYLNVSGMLPFENQIADYLQKDSSNRVLYRVTPIYTDDNLIADGLLLEAKSMHEQDKIPDIEFCVYCYNVQPGIIIDYATGDSHAETSKSTQSKTTYILNTSTNKIHLPDCSAVKDMNPDNKITSNKTLDDLLNQGYTPCSICHPDS